MSQGAEAVTIRHRINGEGELRLPRERGPGRPVPALETQHLGHGRQIWWETDYGRWRLRTEAAAMERFPDFRLLRHQGQLHWMGPLVSRLEHSGRLREHRFVVRVSYPAYFPFEPPTVVIDSPRLPSDTPHLLSHQRPCLYYPGHGSSHGYDHARTTAATLISWTALWIHALDVWRVTRVWPGSEL